MCPGDQGWGGAQGKLYRADQWCVEISLGTLRAIALSGGGFERAPDLVGSPKEMTTAGEHAEVRARRTCGRRRQTPCSQRLPREPLISTAAP